MDDTQVRFGSFSSRILYLFFGGVELIDQVWIDDSGALNFLVDGDLHSMDPMAISSWSELLGYAEPEDALEAILFAAINRTDSEPDIPAGENNWTESYTLLRHREQEREAEAFRAREEGTRDDPRSPLLRSTLAAHRAVHEPVDGGECVMDRCRRAARERMRLPEPARKAGSNSRGRNVASERRAARAAERSRARGRGVGPGAKAVAEELDPDRQKISEAVDMCEDLIGPNIQRFLHRLTDNEEDPLAEDEPQPEPSDPLQDIFKKYGGKAQQ